MNVKLRIALELERMRRRNLKTLHPLEQLFWESTLRCNLNCLHCGSDCHQAAQPDMPLSDFLRVLDEEVIPHTDPHRVMIIVSGGEPTLRADLAEAGRAFQSRCFPWGMVTNGMALTDTLFDRLIDAGLSSMTVSLDGMANDHNWLRGSSRSFDAASHAIQLAVASPIHNTFDVVTCVNSRTIDSLDAIRDYLIELGVTRWRLFTIVPMGRAQTNNELTLTNDQYRKLLDFIATERVRYDQNNTPLLPSYACEGFLGHYEGRVRDHLYHCAAGISIASVLADGSISGCTSVRGHYYQGNIYTHRFWQIWENGFADYRNRQWMKKTEPCCQCNMFRYCEGNGMHLRREDGSLMHCHFKEAI